MEGLHFTMFYTFEEGGRGYGIDHRSPLDRRVPSDQRGCAVSGDWTVGVFISDSLKTN